MTAQENRRLCGRTVPSKCKIEKRGERLKHRIVIYAIGVYTSFVTQKELKLSVDQRLSIAVVECFAVVGNVSRKQKSICKRKLHKFCQTHHYRLRLFIYLSMKNKVERVHFVGIGGVGCSSLAQWLIARGCVVSGSDVVESPTTRKLQSLGAQIYIGHRAENVDEAQVVVHTSAVRANNTEVAFARQKGLPVLLREQLLGRVFNTFPKRIAVCGTHGKTTASSMLSHVLQKLQVEHCAFIGGNVGGNNFVDGRGVVLSEACEYNASFLYLQPTVTLCLNVEFDHPDCYKNLGEVEKTFAELLQKNTHEVAVLPKCLAHLAGKTPTLTFGRGGDVQIFNVRTGSNGCTSFRVVVDRKQVCRCKLCVPGYHNAYNAVAVVAVCKALGLPLLQVVHALQSFGGVERRWQEFPHNVVCDYAHHPTEIHTTLKTALSVAKGRVLCLFQPHTYTRTQALWADFAKVFSCVHGVAFLPIYSAREAPIDGVNSRELCSCAKDMGTNACYVEDFASAVRWVLQNKKQNDLLLVLGAGNVVDVISQIMDALSATT